MAATSHGVARKILTRFLFPRSCSSRRKSRRCFLTIESGCAVFRISPASRQASESDVLHAWQGLGYYARARNLHATAKPSSRSTAAVFPSTSNAIAAAARTRSLHRECGRHLRLRPIRPDCRGQHRAAARPPAELPTRDRLRPPAAKQLWSLRPLTCSQAQRRATSTPR